MGFHLGGNPAQVFSVVFLVGFFVVVTLVLTVGVPAS